METYLIRGESVRQDDDGVLKQTDYVGADPMAFEMGIRTFGVRNELGRIYRVVRLWHSVEYGVFTDGMERFGFSKEENPSGQDPEYGGNYSEIYYRESDLEKRLMELHWEAEGKITPLNDLNFQEAVNNDFPVLVFFWGEWCGPCRQLQGTLEIIAKERSGEIRVASLNVDDQKKTAEKYKVHSIPDMKLFRRGVEIYHHLGNLDKDTLNDELSQNL